MIHSINYANLLQYSPKGISKISDKSRDVKNAIKGGRISKFAHRIHEIISEHHEYLIDFLNEGVTLIPMPRSSPIRESDLWPAHEIAKMLGSFNFGSVSTCLFRSEAIRKASLCNPAEDRPSIAEQYNSMGVNDFVPTKNITLVDDVLTQGRTSIAAASRVTEKFTNVTIRIFSLIKTMSFIEIEAIVNVQTGIITYNTSSGKCKRIP